MPIKISAELSHICPLDDIRRHAAALERLGYFRVWIPDTLVSPWEAWTAAGIAVQHTNRIQIGVGVMNPYTRHPVVAAQMAATLQHLSGGRMAVSVGKGIGRFLEKAGIEQKDRAVEEYISVLRRLIAGERTSFQGNAFHLDGMRIRVPAPEKPVPVYMAAIGVDSWQSAIEAADGVETIWNDNIMEIRSQVRHVRTLPTAVLMPFSVSRSDFFKDRIVSAADLQDRISILEETGFDEAIVAYGDMADLSEAVLLRTG
ncbi:MAG: LLM class flavin-dependent oxidoreductase [Deltaproteobacteria bacterium]|nr:LLM class flavin-dependent oxidoreductase [Deltaproteobacteria bacterium]